MGFFSIAFLTRVCAHMYCILYVHTYVHMYVYVCICMYICLAKYQNYLDTTENRIGSTRLNSQLLLLLLADLVVSFGTAWPGQTCLCLSVSHSVSQSSSLSTKIVHTSFSFRMPHCIPQRRFCRGVACFGSLSPSTSLPLRPAYYVCMPCGGRRW